MDILAVVIKSTGITNPVKLCSNAAVGACGSVKEGKFDGACCRIRHWHNVGWFEWLIISFF